MQIHSSVFLITAFLLLMLPLEWVAAVVIAAVFHELCHIALLYALGGRIIHVKMQPWGCMIESTRLDAAKAFLSILAGPLGSFGLLVFCRSVPNVAVCGFFQGLFNLIPVLPLDGGRLVSLVLNCFCPEQTEQVMKWLEIGILFLLCALSVWLITAISKEFWLFLLVIVCRMMSLTIKFPCKLPRNGVQ